MRRLFLPLALLALTGTLVAQTPQSPSGLTGSVTVAATTTDGDTIRMKNVRFEFGNGVTIVADEAVTKRLALDEATNRGMPVTVELSGNVRMAVKK